MLANVAHAVIEWLAAINPWLAAISLGLFNTALGMLYFFLGWQCRWEWIARRTKKDPEKLEQVRVNVSRHGPPAALLSGCPVIGTPIAICLGLLHCNPTMTVLFMVIGKVVKYAIIVFAVGLTIW